MKKSCWGCPSISIKSESGRHVALVNRVKYYEETGEDIIPEEVQVSKDEEECSGV